jgi:hypothetical protein
MPVCGTVHRFLASVLRIRDNRSDLIFLLLHP